MVAVCTPALASTLCVPNDYPNIPSAIAAASDGDTVLVSPGRYSPSLGGLFEAPFDGLLTKTGPDILSYFYVAGALGTSDVQIMRRVYNTGSRVWGPPLRCGKPKPQFNTSNGGTVGGHVFFFAAINGASQLGYFKSTDSRGTSFGDLTRVPLPYYLCVPFGRTFHDPDVKTWYQPYYAYRAVEDRTSYVLGLLKSQDQGETWQPGPIMYEGPYWFTEAAVTYIGNHRILAFARNVLPGRWCSVSAEMTAGHGHTDSAMTWDRVTHACQRLATAEGRYCSAIMNASSLGVHLTDSCSGWVQRIESSPVICRHSGSP